MVRRRFHSPRLDDEVPFVPVGRATHSLREGATGRFDDPVLVYGLDEGLGVTRTLQEFYWESISSRNSNPQITAAIDFYEIGDRPIGHILLELRNQMVTSCNHLEINDAHKYFKHFDVGYDLWANLHYRDGMKPPKLVASASQKKTNRRIKFATSASVGLLSGGLVQTDVLAGWLDAALSETEDQITDTTMNNLGQKYREWIRTTVWPRSKRVQNMINGKPLKRKFASEILEFLFEDAVMLLSKEIGEEENEARLLIALDSLDEYESSRTPVGLRREWFCHFVEVALPKPILIAMGSRGMPNKWRMGMVDVKPLEETVIPLPRDAVLKILSTIDKERSLKVVDLAFNSGAKEIKAVELADAWGAYDHG